MNTSSQTSGTESVSMKRSWVSLCVAIVVSCIFFSLGWLIYPTLYDNNLKLMVVNFVSCIALQVLTYFCIEYGKAREID